MAKMGSLFEGDLVCHRDNSFPLYIVVGFTYRVSRWGNRRLVKLFCPVMGRIKIILEEQLVMISAANNEESS